jgi:hypothetical protein
MSQERQDAMYKMFGAEYEAWHGMDIIRTAGGVALMISWWINPSNYIYIHPLVMTNIAMV